MFKKDNSDKYCIDCAHWDVDTTEAPCINCYDSKEYFKPVTGKMTVSVAPRRKPIAKAKVETEKKHYIMDDKTGTVAEFEPEEPAKIHRRTPANLYEGIDHDLLKRVRDIMQAYYDTNEEYIEESAKQQLLHDIDIINDIVGYSLQHLHERLIYVLGAVELRQTETNGHAFPYINADEFEAMKTWVHELDVQE